MKIEVNTLLLSNKDLTPANKLILIAIQNNHVINADDTITINMKSIENAVGVDNRTVRRTLSKLSELEIIKLTPENQEGKTRTIEVLPKYLELMKLEGAESGLDKKSNETIDDLLKSLPVIDWSNTFSIEDLTLTKEAISNIIPQLKKDKSKFSWIKADVHLSSGNKTLPSTLLRVDGGGDFKYIPIETIEETLDIELDNLSNS